MIVMMVVIIIIIIIIQLFNISSLLAGTLYTLSHSIFSIDITNQETVVERG